MNLDKITPQVLDKTLQLLLEAGELNAMFRLETETMCKELDVSLDDLRNIFAILLDDGMVSNLNDRKAVFLFLLESRSWEHFQKGGYTTYHNVVELELEKLKEEVDKLQPGKKVTLEQVESFSNIIGTIYSFFS